MKILILVLAVSLSACSSGPKRGKLGFTDEELKAKTEELRKESAEIRANTAETKRKTWHMQMQQAYDEAESDRTDREYRKLEMQAYRCSVYPSECE